MRISAIQGSGYYTNNIKSVNYLSQNTQYQPSFGNRKGTLWGTLVGALSGIGIVALTGGIGAIGIGLTALATGGYAAAGAYLGDTFTSGDKNGNKN